MVPGKGTILSDRDSNSQIEDRVDEDQCCEDLMQGEPSLWSL